ncbi:MAG: hypothetical protein TYPL_1890 [Candidatus Tyloplasma litorale]|nr:MAG: hypothetical protein TYPL_1890 [Mycoplasmatales bacterium]
MLTKNFKNFIKELKGFYKETYEDIVNSIERIESVIQKNEKNEIKHLSRSFREILEITLNKFNEYFNLNLFNDEKISSSKKINLINEKYDLGINVKNSLYNIKNYSNSLSHFENRKNIDVKYSYTEDIHSLITVTRDIWIFLDYIFSKINTKNHNNKKYEFDINVYKKRWWRRYK